MTRLASSSLMAGALAASLTLAAPALAQTQAALNANAARDARSADQALNAQYTTTMAGLSTPTRLLLRNAQRSWISFRDQECRLRASGVQGGSAFPMVQSMCVAQLTQERTRQLRQLAQCEEGDLSCPR